MLGVFSCDFMVVANDVIMQRTQRCLGLSETRQVNRYIVIWLARALEASQHVIGLALVQIKAWQRPNDKPSPEPMIFSLLLHICVTQPQWVEEAPMLSIKGKTVVSHLALSPQCDKGLQYIALSAPPHADLVGEPSFDAAAWDRADPDVHRHQHTFILSQTALGESKAGRTSRIVNWKLDGSTLPPS